MIPVEPSIRKEVKKYFSDIKIEDKKAIPRLFWFLKTQSLYEVFRIIVEQYSFAVEPKNHEFFR